jgi:hypothetical protein
MSLKKKFSLLNSDALYWAMRLRLTARLVILVHDNHLTPKHRVEEAEGRPVPQLVGLVSTGLVNAEYIGPVDAAAVRTLIPFEG